MKQLLNTLYVTSPDAYLSKDGTNVVIIINGESVGRVPIHNIEFYCDVWQDGRQ